MRLVQASATAPELQSRLRDTLNMARDTDKWKKLTRMLSERVSEGVTRSGTASAEPVARPVHYTNIPTHQVVLSPAACAHILYVLPTHTSTAKHNNTTR